jgi:small subunit ribosomal protein S20
MPQLKSAAKRLRQNVKIRARNRAVRAHIKTGMRTVLDAVAKGERDNAVKALNRYFSILDRAGAKGVVKPNFVSRQKARLSLRVNSLKSAA